MRSLKGFLAREPSACRVRLRQVLGGQGGRGIGVPVGIQDGGGMASKQRDLVGELSLLAEGDDGEGAAAASFPIDREVFGVGLAVENSVSSASLRLFKFAGDPLTCLGPDDRRKKKVESPLTFTRLVSHAFRLM